MAYHGFFRNVNRPSDLTSPRLLNETVKRLSDNLRLPMQGSYRPKHVYRQLVYLSAGKTSINNVSNKYKCCNSKLMGRTNLTHHLEKITQVEYLLQRQEPLLGKGIVEHLLRRNKLYDFAIDYVNVPYYGQKTEENVEYVVGSQAKRSTTRFYCYASVSCLKGNKRLTLAAIPVKCDDTQPELIERLLHSIEPYQLQVKCLFLDREFYNVKTLRYLHEKEIPFVMPAVRKGKSGGIRQFERGRTSFTTKYPLGKERFEITLHVVACYEKGRKERHGVTYRFFTSNRVNWSPKKVAEQYRKRFGIESSYRQMNVLKGVTTSRCPALRYLYVLIALLLRNIWMAVRFLCFSEPHVGPKTFDASRFVLKDFVEEMRYTIRRYFFHGRRTISRYGEG